MNTLIVKFERVFDVHRRAHSQFQPQHTQFSFTADGVPHYSVSVPGWPTVEAGMTVTAVLRQSGNWQSIAGWANHQTGELVTPSQGRSFIAALASAAGAIWSSVFLFGAGATLSSPTSKAFAGLLVAALTLLCLTLTRQFLRQRVEVQLIRSLLSSKQPCTE
jgi:hypothetical protein